MWCYYIFLLEMKSAMLGDNGYLQSPTPVMRSKGTHLKDEDQSTSFNKKRDVLRKLVCGITVSFLCAGRGLCLGNDSLLDIASLL